MIAVVALFVASAAKAEVCDKMRPDWSPVQGRTTPVHELATFFFADPLGLGVLLISLAAGLTGSKVLYSVVCLLTLGIALILWQDATMDVWVAARVEGCAGSPVLIFAVLGLLAFGVGMAFYRHSRHRARS